MEIYRKLVATDLESLQGHLMALQPEERRTRFHGCVSDTAIERYCRKIDWFRSVTIGYFVDGRLRGAGQLILDRTWCPREGEFAVTVETPWQGRGVGTELTRRAITIARNRGVAHLVMTCLAANQPMRRIAHKLEGALRFDPGTLAADVEISPITAVSLVEELVSDGAASFAGAAEAFWRVGVQPWSHT